MTATLKQYMLFHICTAGIGHTFYLFYLFLIFLKIYLHLTLEHSLYLPWFLQVSTCKSTV